MSSTSRSAMLKLVRKMFVEFRISFVFMMTMGTCWDGRYVRVTQCLRRHRVCVVTHHNVADDAQTHDDYAEHHGSVPDVGRNLWYRVISGAVDLHGVEDARRRGAVAEAPRECFWRRHRCGCCCGCGIELDHMVDGRVEGMVEEGRCC